MWQSGTPVFVRLPLLIAKSPTCLIGIGSGTDGLGE